MQGVYFKENLFENQFQEQHGVSNFKLLPDSPSVVAHGKTAGHNFKTTHTSPSQRNTSYVTTP